MNFESREDVVGKTTFGKSSFVKKTHSTGLREIRELVESELVKL